MVWTGVEEGKWSCFLKGIGFKVEDEWTERTYAKQVEEESMMCCHV